MHKFPLRLQNEKNQSIDEIADMYDFVNIVENDNNLKRNRHFWTRLPVNGTVEFNKNTFISSQLFNVEIKSFFNFLCAWCGTFVDGER